MSRSTSFVSIFLQVTQRKKHTVSKKKQKILFSTNSTFSFECNVSYTKFSYDFYLLLALNFIPQKIWIL